jgi:hypothetical protein
MPSETLFALALIALVLVLMRPRNYRRWTAWLGRRSALRVPTPPLSLRAREAEASRLSDEDVAARLERALGNSPIGEDLLVQIAAELNAYRKSPWSGRKVIWIADLDPAAAASLARALADLELAEVPILDPESGDASPPEGATRWVCVTTGALPEGDLSRALVFVLGGDEPAGGPGPRPGNWKVERW